MKNRPLLLAEAINSILDQTFTDWEHIIIDDGSEKQSALITSQLAEQDPRIKLFHRSCARHGANVCRNIGISKALGEFVIFLDSDDLLEPDCLHRRVRLMQRNADLDFAVFMMGAFVYRPGDLGQRISNDLHRDDLLSFLFFENPWQTSAPIWRRKALERLGGFDENLPSWQDIDLHIRAIIAGYHYIKLPFVDYHMRWQEDPEKVSTLQRRSPQHLEAGEQLVAKFEQLVQEGPGMNWVRQRALCSLYFFIAERWVDTGRLGNSLRCWKQVRRRKLGPPLLFIPGAIILVLRALCTPAGERVGHKWKGWARLRTNPELSTQTSRRIAH